MTADGILAISALIAACGVALDAAELLGPKSPLDRYFAWEATRFRPMLRRLTQTGPLKWALGVQVAAAFGVAPLVLWAGPAGAPRPLPTLAPGYPVGPTSAPRDIP